MVAEKVETREVFDATREAGYTLFQGYYFRRPVIQTGVTLPAKHAIYMRLLSALNRENLTVLELEELIKQDASLSLKVLRCVNSAALPLRREVRSIHDAVVLLGIGPIRQWASVWALASLNTGGSPELATLALLRARSCELLGARVAETDTAELFLVGLCSLLDAMLGRPMAERAGAPAAVAGGQARRCSASPSPMRGGPRRHRCAGARRLERRRTPRPPPRASLRRRCRPGVHRRAPAGRVI